MGLYSYIEEKYLQEKGNVVSITGAGGKTTFLIEFSKYLKSHKKSVLITTTTKIQSPSRLDFDVDHVFLNSSDIMKYEPGKGESVYFAIPMDDRKCSSPDIKDLEALSRRYDVTLIEADGARYLPLKLHTARDPVVIEGTTLTVAIIGATGLGRKISEVCFGSDESGVCDIGFVQRLMDSPEGVLKGVKGQGVVVVNQCDEVDMDAFRKLRSPVELIFASAREDRIYGTL